MFARLFCSVILLGFSYGMIETTNKNEYMVCKPVAGVFGSLADGNNGSKGLMPVLQGPVGAPGSPGRTGSPGPQGKPDYGAVSKIVEDKLHSLNARLYKVETEIKSYKQGSGSPAVGGGQPKPTQSAEDAKYASDCMKRFGSPINMKNICYKISGGEGLLWTFSAAKTDCEKTGGNMADLNSREEYDVIYDYIDQTYSTVVQAWTGLRYENDTLFLRNGEQATYAKWSSGYPRKGTSSYYKAYNFVYIYIDTSAYVRKLSNAASHTKQAYGICSYDLNKPPTATTAAP